MQIFDNQNLVARTGKDVSSQYLDKLGIWHMQAAIANFVRSVYVL